jgi:hypothetical protein
MCCEHIPASDAAFFGEAICGPGSRSGSSYEKGRDDPRLMSVFE